MTVWHQTIESTLDLGRWRREYRDGRTRYYIFVGYVVHVKVRVPWIAWAVFSPR